MIGEILYATQPSYIQTHVPYIQTCIYVYFMKYLTGENIYATRQMQALTKDSTYKIKPFLFLKRLQIQNNGSKIWSFKYFTT